MELVESPFPARVGKHPPSREASCVAACFSAFVLAIAPLQTTGDPHLTKKSLYSSERARIRALPAVPAEHSPGLPAFNGRSVRNLRHVRAVKAVRAGVSAAAASFAVVVALGFAVPAYAAATAAPPVRALAPQSLTVADLAPAAEVTRDAYGVTVPPPLQWPVAPSSPIVTGFGPRSAPCAACSSNHEGVDYDAGNGSPVRSMAAGLVVETTNSGTAALGVYLSIQHVIDGQTVTSVYAHMQAGSMPLQVGDSVAVGQVVGRVGSTGVSTGPHLHFEIRPGGTTPVNPVAWLRARLG